MATFLSQYPLWPLTYLLSSLFFFYFQFKSRLEDLAIFVLGSMSLFEVDGRPAAEGTADHLTPRSTPPSKTLDPRRGGRVRAIRWPVTLRCVFFAGGSPSTASGVPLALVFTSASHANLLQDSSSTRSLSPVAPQVLYLNIGSFFGEHDANQQQGRRRHGDLLRDRARHHPSTRHHLRPTRHLLQQHPHSSPQAFNWRPAPVVVATPQTTGDVNDFRVQL